MRLNHWLDFLNKRTAWPPTGAPVRTWAGLGPSGTLLFSGPTTAGTAASPVSRRQRLPLRRFPVRSRGRAATPAK